MKNSILVFYINVKIVRLINADNNDNNPMEKIYIETQRI